MRKLILHIPHSGTKIPIKEGFILNDQIIQDEILKLTDWHTEDLYNSPDCEKIVFEYSRIFCDPERFADDSKESMAKVGMGVLYNKTDDGRTLRIISSDLRERIINEFYFKHHSMLSRAVKYQLQTYGKALILDCHSFPNTPLKRSVHQTIPRPEINIGTDNFHTPQKLIDFSVEYFTNRNFTIGLNYPFSGTIVPMEYYRKNNKIESIMLEINRKLYLREISNEKSEHYKVTKLAVQEYIELLRNKL